VIRSGASCKAFRPRSEILKCAQGGNMVRAGCAATTCAPAPGRSVSNPSRWQHLRNATPAPHLSVVTQDFLFLIGCAPIKNPRIPLKQHAMFFSNRPKSACLRAHFVLLASLISTYFSPLGEFLIASGQISKIGLTHSQQMRKLFLTRLFT
jgi:hypothetical protein